MRFGNRKYNFLNSTHRARSALHLDPRLTKRASCEGITRQRTTIAAHPVLLYVCGMDTTRLFFDDDSVDHLCDIRADDDAVAAMQRADDARFVLVRRGRVRAAPGSPVRVVWHSLTELVREGVDVSTIVFLGRRDGRPYFAVIAREAPLTAHDRFQSMTDDRDFVGLRKAAMTMAPADAQMAGHAVHLSNWINRNRYCGTCAAPMRLREGGHKLQCANAECAREEFPRTDAVVITLVTYGDRCLLARQPKMAPRFYSALAGFVEPGETLETAVRREAREEAGVQVARLRYIGSQPWPFPTSLMVGYLAEAASDLFEIDHRELEDGRWFMRAEVAQLCANDTDAPVLLPPRGVMARRLIDEWLRSQR